MFKFVVVVLMAVCGALAKPGIAYTAPLAYAAAPAAVVAQSSQYFTRNYNGIAAPVAAYTAAPVAYTAPVAAAAPLAYSAALTAPFAAPLGYSAYAASPYAAYRYAAGAPVLV